MVRPSTGAFAGLLISLSPTKHGVWEQHKISQKPALFCALQVVSAVMVVTRGNTQIQT
jgi:hypothetical protein